MNPRGTNLNSMISKLIRSFGAAFRGLKFAYLSDQSFRMEIWAMLPLAVFIYFLWPLNETELLFLILSVSLIFIAELINTAFERALERLHPKQHELIGKSKDIASAAVFLALIFTGVVMVFIIYARFYV